MIILSLVSFFYINNENYDTTLNRNRLSCNNLHIIFDNDINLVCNNPIDFSIQYDNLSNFVIDVEKSVNILNNTNHNYLDLNIFKIRESINLLNDTKIIFTEFLNISVIEMFIHNFSIANENILITMEWSKYTENPKTYCEWEDSTNLPISILNQFNSLARSSRLTKLCIDNQAYLHYIEKAPGKIVIISSPVMIIIIVLICFLIVLILISLYFVALHKMKRTHLPVAAACKEEEEEIKEAKIVEEEEEVEDVFFIKQEEEEEEQEEKQKEEIPKKKKNLYDLLFNNKSEDTVFSQFIKQLFDVGNSAGSIIFEAINLVRTFQKINSTRSFSILLSKDCLKMFSWASKLIEMIISSFYFREFSDIENFYFINYVFPLLIITFLISLFLNYRYLLFLSFLGLTACFGFGFGYIKYDYKIAICFIIPSFVLIVISIIIFVCILRNCDCLNDLQLVLFPITTAVFNSFITISLILTPFFIDNLYFLGSCCFIFLIIAVITIIIDLILSIQSKLDVLEDIVHTFPDLFSNFLTLLFIPSTSIFVCLIKDEYKNSWNVIIGFVFFSLVVPLVLYFILKWDEMDIKMSKYYSIFGHYMKDDPTFPKRTMKEFWFSLFDIIRQVLYAFFSAYDMLWFCLGLEILWILSFSLIRPFDNISDYVLQGGSSLIIIISNSLAIAFEYNKIESLSFGSSIGIVIAACIPAIVSLYVYFGIDFDMPSDEDKKIKSDISNDVSEILLYFFLGLAPFAWTFFGMIVPIIKEHFDKYYSKFKVI